MSALKKLATVSKVTTFPRKKITSPSQRGVVSTALLTKLGKDMKTIKQADDSMAKRKAAATKAKPKKMKIRKLNVELDMAQHKVLNAIALADDMSINKACKKGNVNPQTVYKWRSGATRFPRMATLAAVAGAIGFRFALIKKDLKVDEVT